MIQSKFYLGEVGNGAAMKLVVNMIMGRYHLTIYRFISWQIPDSSSDLFFSLPMQYDGIIRGGNTSKPESWTRSKCTCRGN